MSKLNGFLALRTPKDLLRKLEADFARLGHSPADSIEAQYAAFYFFVTAQHLPDWICAMCGKTKFELRSYPESAVVSHVANGAKHFFVDVTRHKEVRDTTIHQGAFQASVFQVNAFDVAELRIELENGVIEPVVAVATRVLAHWRAVVP
jgi:hypothetical protein